VSEENLQFLGKKYVKFNDNVHGGQSCHHSIELIDCGIRYIKISIIVRSLAYFCQNLLCWHEHKSLRICTCLKWRLLQIECWFWKRQTTIRLEPETRFQKY